MIKKLFDKVKSKKKELGLRKSPSEYSLSLFDSIHQVPADHWKEVVKDKIFMQHEYLSLMEACPPANMQFRYAMLYDDKRPVGACSFQVIDLTGESLGTLVDPEVDEKNAKCFTRNVKSYMKKNAGKFSLRFLICGNAFASGEYGFAYADDADRAKLFHGLADAIYRVRRGEKLNGQVTAILIKDYYKSSVGISGELQKFGYRGFSVEPSMIVDVDPAWKKFEDYLDAMSSKYRTRTKAVLKKGKDIERRLLTRDEILANGKRIKELYDAVHYKAKFRLASLTPEYFGEAQLALPDSYTFTGYYLEGKMVAFRSTFFEGDALDAHFIGMDYKQNRKHDIYQNILYDYVREGIERGMNKVNLGRTAAEMKSTIGARPHDLTCYLRHRNPVSNRIIKPFIDYLKPSEWVQRNPFKEERVKNDVAEVVE